MTPPRVHSDERGATAVLVGVLLPVLLALSALGVGTLAMSGGELELQRAADAAALSTAARLPVVNVQDPPGLSALKPGIGHITGYAGDICEENLASAAMTDAFAANVSCSAEVLPFGLQLSQALQAGLDVLPNYKDKTLPALLRNVNVPALLPGLATPYVEVTATSDLDPPLRGLISPGEPVGLEATAVARRRIKNAVLVPATDASVVCDGSKETLLLVKQSFSDETLGSVLDMLEQVSGGLLSSVTVDECRMNPNPTLAVPREPALDTLDELADLMEGTALAGVAPSVRELRMDVGDVYNPPASGDVPSQHDLIRAAALDGEDVLVVLANPISGGGGLLSGLIGASQVPILDVVAVPASTLANCDLDLPDEEDFCFSRSDAVGLSQGTGLFRATLVEEGSAQ